MFKKNLKRVFTLVLVASMMVGAMAGCADKEEEGGKSTPAPTQAAGTENNDKTDPGASTPDRVVESFGNGEYVYKDSVTVLSANWNPHNYETSDEGYPRQYLTSGLYEFFYNDELHPVEGKAPYEGYVILPEMAAAMPVDVTEKVKAEHPEFGIPESATEGFAYAIDLNPLAKWENGTPINADTYVYSMKQLLDPLLKNYRSTDYMDSEFVIANAKNYFYQGTTAFNGIGSSVSEYLANGNTADGLYVDMSFWGVTSPDGTGYASVTDDTLVRDPAVEDETAAEAYVSGKYLYETYLGPGCPYESYSGTYIGTLVNYEDNYDFANVGIMKTGDHQITLVLGKALKGFDLYYNLSGNWLVYEPYYEAGKSQIGETNAWANNYCTSLETTMSYGPYKMVAYQTDKSMRFEKNENWFGYTDGKHIYVDPEDGLTYPMYQTTAIECQVVQEAATRKLMFLKGQLMGYGLQADDMEEYRGSDYCYATPATTTFFLIFNGYMKAIKEREAAADFDTTKYDLETITLNSFRKAVAVTYDKEAFATAISPARSGGYGIVGTAYVYDTETGAKYRDTDPAKRALCEFYSVDVSKFASLDDAVDSITGYDPETAKALYKQAFDEAIAAGYITDANGDGKSDQAIEIIYSSAATSDFMVKTIDYLNNKMAEVTAGTPFEGKISIKESAPLGDPGWSDNIKAGLTDTVLAGWSGSDLNPFSLTDLYVNPNRSYDAKWFNATTVDITMTIDGEEITMTLKEWSDVLNGSTIEKNGKAYNFGAGIVDIETRLEILAKIESTVLGTYNYIPMLEDASMSLLSQQVYYVVEEYNPVMYRGGITYMKYNYDETAWSEYVNSQPNGQLSY